MGIIDICPFLIIIIIIILIFIIKLMVNCLIKFVFKLFFRGCSGNWQFSEHENCSTFNILTLPRAQDADPLCSINTLGSYILYKPSTRNMSNLLYFVFRYVKVLNNNNIYNYLGPLCSL